MTPPAPTRIVPTRLPLHVVEVELAAAEEVDAATAEDVDVPAVDEVDVATAEYVDVPALDEVDVATVEDVDAPAVDDKARADQGETFLLIHGYGGSSYMWRYWTEPLAARGRVLLVDLKGFGSAPKPDDGRYTPSDLARTIVDLVRELDLRRLTIVGQSLGGGITLLAALALRDATQDRLSRLVLLAPAAYRQRLPPFVALSRRPRLAAALFRLIGVRRIVRWVIRSIVYDPGSVTDGQVEEYSRALRTNEGRRAAFAVGRQIVPDDIEERARRFPELDLPVLLIWGDHDRVIPLWVGERLEAELPDARLAVIERCGHLAPEERPSQSLRLLEDFLDAHPIGSRSAY